MAGKTKKSIRMKQLAEQPQPKLRKKRKLKLRYLKRGNLLKKGPLRSWNNVLISSIHKKMVS